MNCDELRKLLADYQGNELEVEVRHTFEVHVKGCDTCDVLVHSYSYTAKVGRALPRCGLPPAFEARLRALLEPELKKTGQAE